MTPSTFNFQNIKLHSYTSHLVGPVGPTEHSELQTYAIEDPQNDSTAMSTHRCPSLALLRSLKRAPQISQRCNCQISSAQRRAFRTARALKEEQRSFKGQLYESTAQRLQRERVEQARFAKLRGEGGAGRNAAATFGKIIYNGLRYNR